MDGSSYASPRRIVEMEVEITAGQTAHRFFGESRNMSDSGMLVVAEDPKAPGTAIRFRCREFRGQGEVVWRRECEEGSLLGIRFTELSPEDRAALERVLADSVSWL